MIIKVSNKVIKQKVDVYLRFRNILTITNKKLRFLSVKPPDYMGSCSELDFFT